MTSTPSPISRRSVTTGLAWAAPAVAVTAAAPYAAASVQGCYPLTWSTTAVTAPSTQTIASDSPTGDPANITVSAGASGPYHFADGNYGKATFQTGTGGVYLGTWADPGTTATQRNTGGQTITITYPAGATGPVSFTIGDITAAAGATTDSYGASTYTDAVQVTNNGAVVAPTSVTGATSSAGWVTGTSTTPGSATYTISSPGTIVITLRNTATTVNGAHPNQTVSVSNVVCGTTAPAPVTPPAPVCNPAPVSSSGATAGIAQDSNYIYNDVSFGRLWVNNLPAGVTVTNVSTTWYLSWDDFRWLNNTTGTGNGAEYQTPTGWAAFSATTGTLNYLDRSGSNATLTAAYNQNGGSLAGPRGSTDIARSYATYTSTWTPAQTNPASRQGAYTTDAQGCVDFVINELGKFRLRERIGTSLFQPGTRYAAFQSFKVTLSDGRTLCWDTWDPTQTPTGYGSSGSVSYTCP